MATATIIKSKLDEVCARLVKSGKNIPREKAIKIISRLVFLLRKIGKSSRYDVKQMIVAEMSGMSDEIMKAGE